MYLRNHFALLFVLLSCRLTNANAQFRITDGRYTNIEESRHSVAIFYDEIYICAGSIVTTYLVITSSDCVKYEPQEYLAVIAGLTDVSERFRGKGQKRSVTLIEHGFDIAVVKMDIEFLEDGPVRRISLCNDNDLLVPGLTMEISGWGSLIQNIRAPRFLKTKSVQLVDTQECKTTYANTALQPNLEETTICAGCGGDFCFGDSGAGGVVNTRLCAVAQGSCGYEHLPGLYIDITNPRVRNFILLSETLMVDYNEVQLS